MFHLKSKFIKDIQPNKYNNRIYKRQYKCLKCKNNFATFDLYKFPMCEKCS